MDAVDTACGATATIRVYDGTRPTDPDTALSGNTLLAELACSNPVFGASSSGVITADTITDDSSADNTGTPTWATIHDGTNRIVDFSAGVGSGDLNFSASITAGATVSISSLTITEGNGG